ncbi:ABC transporter ATP-binding protein [Gymnodinialimonas hymeniacidonis]|uniref:ABC transporter ATP-binding protein n=1 Tax=Gymnodinialimonas hymeniacidonis TaxID=3126508 RepID=UPI0034C6CCA6
MAGIKVEQLRRTFGEFVAVDDINFHIEDGEFIFFLGPSGCGKTTTLRMIAGLLMPSAGRIEIGDRNVTYLKPRYRNVGMVFQANVLYHHLSVFQNLAYPLKVRGMSKATIRSKVDEVAALLQIEDVLRRSTDKLSAGQAQRVAIGRMLVRDADVFLMDEPISHLDAKLRAHMRTELRHLQKELARTTVFVSHDQLEAMSMADRIAVINEGQVLQFASPQEIFDRPATEFVAGFVGEPHMNILSVDLQQAKARGDGFAANLDTSWLDHNKVVSGPQRLGVRPEHLSIHAEAVSGSFPSEIKAVETMGAENLFSFDIGGQDFKVRATTQDTDRFANSAGSVVHLSADQERIYLFDAKSGHTTAQAAATDPTRGAP